MPYVNQKFWKNAYLIEFRQDSLLEEAFTFSVPPQSEEFVYPQRIQETKTFGGSVFEDYGNDSIQISLSGTTINQSLKYIYRARFPHKVLSGEDEIFYLKDIIDKYGKYDKLQNKQVYLFSLESGHANKKMNKKYWRIWIKEFSIKRSKDRPFSYDYTLKATGLPIEKKASETKGRFLEKLNKINESIQDSINKLVNDLDDLTEKVESFWQENVLSYISAVKNTVQGLNDVLEIITSLENGVDLIEETFSEISALGDEITRTITLPYTCMRTINSSCTELVQNVNKIKQWFSGKGITNSNQMKLAVEHYDESADDLVDAFNSLIGNIERDSNKVVASAKQKIAAHNSFPVIIPNGNGNSDSVIIAHGYKEYIYTSGDDWATIAFKTYKDSSYSTMLQFYNKDIELENLTPGTTIYCPILDDNSKVNYENQVYSEYDSMDSLGKDIEIKNADFSVLNGDLFVTKNENTLNQAITNRLSTAINSRVRNVIYGIRNETGIPYSNKDAAATYITASIEQTILEDPRIDSVENISWNGTQDALEINAEYTTNTGKNLFYQGVV